MLNSRILLNRFLGGISLRKINHWIYSLFLSPSQAQALDLTRRKILAVYQLPADLIVREHATNRKRPHAIRRGQLLRVEGVLEIAPRRFRARVEREKRSRSWHAWARAQSAELLRNACVVSCRVVSCCVVSGPVRVGPETGRRSARSRRSELLMGKTAPNEYRRPPTARHRTWMLRIGRSGERLPLVFIRCRPWRCRTFLIATPRRPYLCIELVGTESEMGLSTTRFESFKTTLLSFVSNNSLENINVNTRLNARRKKHKFGESLQTLKIFFLLSAKFYKVQSISRLSMTIKFDISIKIFF